MASDSNRKLAFDLRPYAALINPGVVLYLQRDETARHLCKGTGLSREALGHPCVVVGPPEDCDYAKILLLTTFGGRKLHKHIREPYWQEYLPVEPTEFNSKYPGVRLRINGAPRNLGGYVNIIEYYWVPWRMLTKWASDKPIDHACFDEASTELILRFMEWATYDMPTGYSRTTSYQQEPFNWRLNSVQPTARKGNVEQIQIPCCQVPGNHSRPQKREDSHTTFCIPSNRVLGVVGDDHMIHLEYPNFEGYSPREFDPVASHSEDCDACAAGDQVSTMRQVEERLRALEKFNWALLGGISLLCVFVSWLYIKGI